MRKILATGVLALLTAVGLVGTAHATTGNIDPNEPVSLTINKFEVPEGGVGAPGDGTTTTTTGWTPLEGVGFTVTPVLNTDGSAIDLTTPAGWLAAQTVMDAGTTVAPARLGPAIPVATGADGTVSVPNPTKTLYLVSETTPPAGAVGTVEDFFVTLPYPQDNGEWLYEVNVYPKNSRLTGSKTVDDAAAKGLGDTVSWTITVTIPRSAEPLTAFAIRDVINSRLAYTANSSTLTVDSAPVPTTAYTDTAGSPLIWTFTDMDWVNDNAGKSLVITYDTTVVTLGNGTIPNVAEVFVNDPTLTDSIDYEAETLWGAVKIIKHAEGDEDKVLQGAVFQIFATETDASAKTNPISVSGATSFATAADGTITIPGLSAKTTTGTSYWLVETQAPAGYVVDETPIEVVVTPGATADAIAVTVANAQADKTVLPGLGATGAMIAYVVGAALIIGVLGWMIFGWTRRVRS